MRFDEFTQMAGGGIRKLLLAGDINAYCRTLGDEEQIEEALSMDSNDYGIWH